MNVRLPDGRIVRNVPEGTTQEELLAKFSSAPQANPEPEENRLQALGISAGRGVDKILNGITQMYLGAIGDDKALGGLKQNVETNAALYKPLADKFPIVTSIGESAPLLSVPGSPILGGAALGALGYGSVGDRTKEAGLNAAGAKVGQLIGAAVPRLLKPAGAGVKGLSDDAAGAAERIGYKLSAGEVSKNPALMNLENYFGRAPGTSSMMLARQEANQAAINRAAASSIGQSSDELSEATFARAKDAIGGQFQRLQAVTKPDFTNGKLLNALTDIEAANAAKGAGFRSPKIDSLVDDALNLAASGKISGKAYKEIRSELSSRAEAAFTAKDAPLGQALKTVRAELDNAAKSSLSANDRAAWDGTRELWRNYKTLTKGLISEGGNVSPARTAQALRGGGDGFRTGAFSGPLVDVARLGEGVKGVLNPNSAALMQTMSTVTTPSGLINAGVNKIAGDVYMNPLVQSYLGRGLLDVGKPGAAAFRAAGMPVGAGLLDEWLGVR